MSFSRFLTPASTGKKNLAEAVMTGGCILLLAILLPACSKNAPEHPIVTATGDKVILPLEEVGDGIVRFFTYKYSGKNVNFIVRTDGNGRLHTHFDACYGCYQYKMGYYVEGNEIVCRACRYRYNLDEEMWDFIGPCAPITFKHKIRNGNLLIDVSVLERGARFF